MTRVRQRWGAQLSFLVSKHIRCHSKRLELLETRLALLSEHSRWAGRGQVWGFNKECADPEWWIHSQLLQTWQVIITFLILPNMKFRFKANGQKVTMARVCRAYGVPPCVCAVSKDNLGSHSLRGQKKKKKNQSMYKLPPKTCGFPHLASNLWPQ